LREKLRVGKWPMLHTSKLRDNRRNGFIRRLKRLAASLALLILLPVAASAYTVVLRDGRSVEIPSGFSVTPAGITYEYAPGLYVTIQMTSIDVAATERANGEPQGSLLARTRAKPRTAPSSVSSSASGNSARTLTDKELEGVRKRREAAEAQYEQRRRELGLPSVEDTRLKREEELRRMNEMAAQSDAEEAQAESYWRERAEELRTALAVNEAEMRYLRSKMKPTLYLTYPYPYTSVTPFPYVMQYPNSDYTLPGPLFPARNPFVPQSRDFTRREPLPGRAGRGAGVGPMRGQPSFPRGPYTGFPRRRPIGRPGNRILPLPVYAPLAYGYDNYDNQGAIQARMEELRAERIRLETRWRLLEEEARRAGVPPGWLRP
jgi:hypothetical protein